MGKKDIFYLKYYDVDGTLLSDDAWLTGSTEIKNKKVYDKFLRDKEDSLNHPDKSMVKIATCRSESDKAMLEDLFKIDVETFDMRKYQVQSRVNCAKFKTELIKSDIKHFQSMFDKEIIVEIYDDNSARLEKELSSLKNVKVINPKEVEGK